MAAPLKTFIIYASADRDLRISLERQLKSLIDNNLIQLWSDKEILPGEVWDSVLTKHLLVADLYLMLISADFFNSDFIREKEFVAALHRLEGGNALVIPIICRDCDWEAYAEIKKLQVLPPNGTAVTDLSHWGTIDKAWATVTRQIRKRIEVLNNLQIEIERSKEIEKKHLEEEKARRDAAEMEQRKKLSQLQQNLQKIKSVEAFPGESITTERKIAGFLISYSLREIGEYWPVYLGKNTIGSAQSGNDILLNEKSISAYHSILNVRKVSTANTNEIDILYVLSDNGSTNGTKVNGKDLIFQNNICMLKNGDTIDIGGYRLILLCILDV